MSKHKVIFKKPSGGMAKSGPKLESQINKVYDLNKRLIRKHIQPTELRTRREIFVEHIKQLVKDGYTLNQALDKMAGSREFTPARQVAKENFWKKLREDSDLYERFRRIKGWNEKFDMNKLQFKVETDKDIIYYYYSGNGIIKIIKRKSPEGENDSGFMLLAPGDFKP